MLVLRNFIKCALVLQLALYVNAGCDVCTASFNLALCSNPRLCTPLAFNCHDWENPEDECANTGHVALLVPNQGNCTDPPVTSTPITTTTAATGGRTPAEICAAEQRHGFFAHENDTTCVWFFQCYAYNDEWLAIGFMCPVRFYFDKNLGYCVPNKPAYCD